MSFSFDHCNLRIYHKTMNNKIIVKCKFKFNRQTTCINSRWIFTKHQNVLFCVVTHYNVFLVYSGGTNPVSVWLHHCFSTDVVNIKGAWILLKVIPNSLFKVLPCDNMPQLTAVAAFDNGQYVSKGGLAGLFMGCDADGFKVCIKLTLPNHVLSSKMCPCTLLICQF